MGNTIAIRLEPSLIRELKRSARIQKKTRSELIRDALTEYLDRTSGSGRPSPYQVLLSLMPLERSAIKDLGARSEFHLRQKFHARSDPR